MRPTFSIIAFTVLSGTGYGLWFLVGLALATDWLCAVHVDAELGNAYMVCIRAHLIDYALIVGFILVSAGLVSSLGHLGQPQRAWRALSQWRSSWLSREGVLAIATYMPAAALIFVAVDLLLVDSIEDATAASRMLDWQRPLGVLLSVGAALTVYCTAHIYSSLKPVRAWQHPAVVPLYLLFALYGGALCWWALRTLPSALPSDAYERHAGLQLVALILLAAVCAGLKWIHWRGIDRMPPPGAGHATGLDAQGTVHSFEQPHTEENYLTHEMGFVLARKHARKLRAIALVCAFAVPGLLALAALALPPVRTPAARLALVVGMTGIFVERWLFFAEARHTVIAYYGR